MSRPDTDLFPPFKDGPIAIIPHENNKRMAAQKGRFTVHGDHIYWFRNNICKKHLIDTGFMKCVFIDPRKTESIIEHLREIGISRSTLFPDLDGLSKELKGRMGALFYGREKRNQ